jgi:hypothetical protein
MPLGPHIRDQSATFATIWQNFFPSATAKFENRSQKPEKLANALMLLLDVVLV